MQVHHCRQVVLGLCLLALLILMHQVSSAPVQTPDAEANVQKHVSGLLTRKTRMTPLWRLMGSKPYGAYCQDHFECSTRLCWKGHCSFSVPVHS